MITEARNMQAPKNIRLETAFLKAVGCALERTTCANGALKSAPYRSSITIQGVHCLPTQTKCLFPRLERNPKKILRHKFSFLPRIPNLNLRAHSSFHRVTGTLVQRPLDSARFRQNRSNAPNLRTSTLTLLTLLGFQPRKTLGFNRTEHLVSRMK
jgi:hypothetical protein